MEKVHVIESKFLGCSGDSAAGDNGKELNYQPNSSGRKNMSTIYPGVLSEDLKEVRAGLVIQWRVTGFFRLWTECFSPKSSASTSE
jgi:hypothetical protein